MVTVTKKDLVALGYGNSFAADIIRLAKSIFPAERAKSCGLRGVAGVWGSAPFQQSPCI